MRTLSNIQVLRGLAALGVLVAHAAGMLLYGDVPVSLPNVEWGAFGVDVFFVISGFVMAYAERANFGCTAAVGPFALRRLARILPLYWLATLAFALLVAPYGAPAREMRAFAGSALQGALFVPTADGNTSLLPTGWTLFYEMGFYALFALALPFRRGPALIALSAVIAALAAAGAAKILPERLGCVANLQALEFVFGLGLAEARRAGIRVPARLGAAVAAATALYAVLAAPHLDGWTMWRGISWGIPAALIVGSLALSPEPPPSRPRRLLERLGDASYAVYMVHFPLFWAIGRLIPGLPRSGPHAAQAYVVLLIVSGLLISLLVHRFIEGPIGRWLGAVLRQLGATRPRLADHAVTAPPSYSVP